MPRLGAHMSVAGGLPRAVERAVVHRCDALQIFAKNANQWRGRPIPREEVREFRATVKAAGIEPVVSHASYLINLASTNPVAATAVDRGDGATRSIAPKRSACSASCCTPAAYTAGSEADGLTLIADALLALLRERRRGKTMVLLEHTAGQGTTLGATFEQLASIIAKMNDHRRVGVCLDTCHLLASGYDICSPEGYASTFAQFGRLVGFDRLKAFHLNDSKKPLGSRVDRHEHIGQGLPRPRTVPAHRQRSPLPRSADAARDAEGGGQGDGTDRDRSARRTEPQYAARARGGRTGGKGRRGGRGRNRGNVADRPILPVLPILPYLPSPNTSASNRQIFGAALPRVSRKPGLLAGVREKRLRVPVPFGRHLRQQQAALPSLFDDQTVAADDDVLRPGDRLERAEQRDLDVDVVRARRATAAETADRCCSRRPRSAATTWPSGSVGSTWPMQPRRSPRL